MMRLVCRKKSPQMESLFWCKNSETENGGKNMGLMELFILAVGLSMDAFAVAVCKGLAMKEMSWK